MNRLLALSTVAVLISLGTATYAVGAAEDQKQTVEVTNWKGKHLGIATEVVTNPSTGGITFIIVYLDQEAKKEIAVPLAAFSSYDHTNGTLILNVGEEDLVSAPEFHDSDLENPGFAESVYRFFGLVPPWTEKENEQQWSS